jgi:uncharacterized protein with GYD domain
MSVAWTQEPGWSRYILLIKANEAVSGDILQGGSAGAADQVQGFINLGARIIDEFVVSGPYDLAILAEFPDDETFIAATLGLNAGGYYTEALRCFTLDVIDRAQEKLAQLSPVINENVEGEQE